MATFSRLEDIQVWQKARQLTKRIYKATEWQVFTRLWIAKSNSASQYLNNGEYR